jgi:DNA replication protein DnaC
MEIPEHLNQNSQPTAQQPSLIGWHKYNHLKSFPESTLTEMEIVQVNDFESKHSTRNKPSDKLKNYISNMLSIKEETSFKITPLRLWNVFKHNFSEVTRREWAKNEFTAKNLEVLIYYFSQNEKFFQCDNLSKLSNPSFDKGLLIVGTFGNGKTSVMKTFERIFKNTKGVSFKGYTANEVVTMYEKCSDSILKAEFNAKVNSGSRYFDDVKTERQASNYGKVNLFKDILEIRYNNRIIAIGNVEKFNKTFITMNYKEGYEGDLQSAVNELGELYGGRVYDRLFDMFNIIEFKGPSFRK